MTDLVLMQATVWSRLMSGSMLVAVPVALAAGLVGFFSPCVLPLLPGYLSFATGMSAAEIQEGAHKGRTLAGTVGFVLGLAFVFVLTGSFAGGLGGVLLRWTQPIMVGSGVLMVLLGLVFMGMVPLGQRDIRIHRVPRLGVATAPLLGIIFGLGWTPCLGPSLLAVTSLALNEATATKGAVLSACYALGLGIPFVLAGLGLERMGRTIGFVKRHQQAVQRIGGGLMILVGLLLATGLWNKLINSVQVLVSQYTTPI